jgi:tetratricopeptide (TPR) repeat protein
MKSLYALGVGLLLVLTPIMSAKPAEQGRPLTAEEQKEADRLKAETDGHVLAARFEEAVQAAMRLVDYRAKRQGAKHWQVIDARLQVERCQRLGAVAAKDRTQVVHTLKLVMEGTQLQQRLRYQEAEAKLRKALALCQKVLGEQHAETAFAYSFLASCLANQGRPAEALRLFQKALAINLRVLGEQHFFTAGSYASVAVTLGSLGKAAEALPMHQKALAIYLGGVCEQHPATATGYNNVALCLDNHGKSTDALPLHQRALAIRLKILGEQHPDTAGSYNNVAIACTTRASPARPFPCTRRP